MKRLLLPVDGSDCSDQAVALGLELARELDASVTFLYVAENPVVELYGVPYGDQLRAIVRRVGEETLARCHARADAAGVPTELRLLEGQPIDVIRQAETGHDLVVMSTHGRRGVNRWLFGSVAEGILRRTEIPCMVIRCHEDAPEIEGARAESAAAADPRPTPP